MQFTQAISLFPLQPASFWVTFLIGLADLCSAVRSILELRMDERRKMKYWRSNYTGLLKYFHMNSLLSSTKKTHIFFPGNRKYTGNIANSLSGISYRLSLQNPQIKREPTDAMLIHVRSKKNHHKLYEKASSSGFQSRKLKLHKPNSLFFFSVGHLQNWKVFDLLSKCTTAAFPSLHYITGSCFDTRFNRIALGSLSLKIYIYF